jgi:hypothetical protein
MFILCVVSVNSIYSDPPPYFISFYCNLGAKTMAESGNYICISPKVIERADNFALALVEFNKIYTFNIWFEAEITSSPGVNVSSVGIRLIFKSAYTTKYSYMAVVIGYQPENDWIDLMNVKIPANLSQS